MSWSEAYRPLLLQVAASLQASPEALRELIDFESRWNPAAYNASGAVGLIQFMPRTLKDMGLLSSVVAANIPKEGEVPAHVKVQARDEFLRKYPTVELQLTGPVVAYLRKGAPYPNAQALNMQVFLPAARAYAADTSFATIFRSLGKSDAYIATFKKQNPGIDTIADYNALVKKKVSIWARMRRWVSPPSSPPPLPPPSF